jgi:hypothetical protein
MTFKDENRALSELVRELMWLRSHNLQFKPGDPQQDILMFAEAALTSLALEHFVRIVVGDEATDRDTLYPLLEKAVAKGLIRLPWPDQKEGITRICNVRNTLLHANYAQAAAQAGCSSVGDYFKKQFASEIEALFEITDFVVRQIDPNTGKPY